MTAVDEHSVSPGGVMHDVVAGVVRNAQLGAVEFPKGSLAERIACGQGLPRMPMTIGIPEVPMRIRPIGAPVDPMEQLRMLGIGQKESLPPAKILALAKRLEVHVAAYGSYILHLRPNTVEDIASAHRSAGADKALVDDWVDIATLLRQLHN